MTALMPGERNKLAIVITAAEEPVVVNAFVRDFLRLKGDQVQGIGLIQKSTSIPVVVRGKARRGEPDDAGGAAGVWGRRWQSTRRVAGTVGRRLTNLLSLLLIFGFREAGVQSLRLAGYRLRNMASRLGWRSPSCSLEAIAAEFGVPVWKATSVNDPAFINRLAELRPDIVVNQAHGILGEEFLRIPKLGVLNRHNSLLPRNRGRFSVFWALYRGESVTGVSIHFVVKALDAGPILVQKPVAVTADETVASLARKCYAIAPAAMAEAIELLESGSTARIPNDDAAATYNSNPTLRDALNFRIRRLRR